MNFQQKKYLIFCSVVFAGILTVLFVKPSPEFLYSNAGGDCSGRSSFMYNAIHNNTANADVVLIGSSRTMNGINDSLVNTMGETKFLNLGYCRYGRNLDYFFAEEYCSEHKPSSIIIEVRETEGDNAHPVTAFFLPVTSILEGASSGNADLPADLYNKWLCNLKFIRGKLFGRELSVGKQIVTHGFWEGKGSGNIKELITERKRDSVNHIISGEKEETINRNSNFYFEKFKKLAAEKNIKLYFLYMGSYGNLAKRPSQEEEYLKYGKLLIPADSISSNVLNYSNFNHLNRSGAAKLSIWLTREFSTVEKQ